MHLPTLITDLSRKIVSNLPWLSILGTGKASDDDKNWSDFRPEAGVVNFYQFKDTLTAHVDQSEVDAIKPLVSLSLGPSAVFLAGGATRDERPLPILLSSGDVLLMVGPSRRIFHGVPRIRDDMQFDALDGYLDSRDDAKMAEFTRSTRINVNVRHVFAG